MCSSIELLSWTVLFAAETLVIIAGNIITIIVFWKMRSVLKKTYYLLINLSIADLIVGISAVKITINNIWNLKISQNYFLMRFLALDALAETASLGTLMFIAFERFYAVTYPLNHRTLSKQVYVHGVVWPWAGGVLVALISFSPMLFPNSVFPLIAPWILTSLAVIGVFSVSILYTLIWISSRKHDPRIARDRHEQDKRLVKTLFIVTLTTVVTWVPFVVTPVPLQDFHEMCNMHIRAFLAGRFFQLANSFLNPAVYCFRMPEFKKILRKLFSYSRSGVISN